MDGELGAVVLHLLALLLEVQRDPALAELLRQLLRRVDVRTPDATPLPGPRLSWTPPTLTPALPSGCPASCGAEAGRTQPWVGQQPMAGQVQPSPGSRSLQATPAPKGRPHVSRPVTS